MPTFYIPAVSQVEITEAQSVLIEARREELEALAYALFEPDRIAPHMRAALDPLVLFASRSKIFDMPYGESAQSIACEILDFVSEFGESEDIFLVQAYSEVIDGKAHDTARFRATVCEYVLGKAAYYLTFESEGGWETESPS